MRYSCYAPVWNDCRASSEMEKIANRYTQLVEQLEAANAGNVAITETIADGLLTLSAISMEIRTANGAAAKRIGAGSGSGFHDFKVNGPEFAIIHTLGNLKLDNEIAIGQ